MITGISVHNCFNHLGMETNAFKRLRLNTIKFYMGKFNHLLSVGIVL